MILSQVILAFGVLETNFMFMSYVNKYRNLPSIITIVRDKIRSVLLFVQSVFDVIILRAKISDGIFFDICLLNK